MHLDGTETVTPGRPSTPATDPDRASPTRPEQCSAVWTCSSVSSQPTQLDTGPDQMPNQRPPVHFLYVPAIVLGLALDVLATNATAIALYGGFARLDNILRMVFLDPAAPEFYVD